MVMTSYPPRKCGIATYSQDLINAIEDKFKGTFSVKVCALEKNKVQLDYPSEVIYTLKTSEEMDYSRLAKVVNIDESIKIIYLQHEFGLYGGVLGDFLIKFMKIVKVPIITTFHTILPNPSQERKQVVQQIASHSRRLIVMTKLSREILISEYQISGELIVVVSHGTHLIKPQQTIKRHDVPFPDKIIMATFGLISEGKSIETALFALPAIVEKFPQVLYLIIGKTHPEVLQNEGEKYRDYLLEIVQDLKMGEHVLFVNKYLSLKILLEYLERTELYLFTSKDPLQAVSGTLVYAMSAGCPILSTPIPHTLELLDGAGMNFDFQNAEQLAESAILMLSSPGKMEEMRLNGLHRISSTAWQNSAIAHLELANSILKPTELNAEYEYPPISLTHIKRMTTDFGMIQFARIATPDKSSGYTLDDNARALVAVAKDFDLTGNFENLHLINCYLDFILFCQQENGSFLNYVTINQQFFAKNKDENLEDANGRAIWALGEFLSLRHLLQLHMQTRVEIAFRNALPMISELQSPRAMAFCIKGLYYYYQFKKDPEILKIITLLADNLISKYRGVSNEQWQWYEHYLTYANAVLPEALLLAGKCMDSTLYKETAKKTFDFLLSITNDENGVSMISNTGRHHKGQEKKPFGEQPIEYAYTVLALDCFYEEFGDEKYLSQLKSTFNWFLGDNHLHQIIYNPSTGGCYDGLEEFQVNLNQGAESTVSYLLARLTIEKYND